MDPLSSSTMASSQVAADAAREKQSAPRTAAKHVRLMELSIGVPPLSDGRHDAPRSRGGPNATSIPRPKRDTAHLRAGFESRNTREPACSSIVVFQNSKRTVRNPNNESQGSPKQITKLGGPRPFRWAAAGCPAEDPDRVPLVPTVPRRSGDPHHPIPIYDPRCLELRVRQHERRAVAGRRGPYPPT